MRHGTTTTIKIRVTKTGTEKKAGIILEMLDGIHMAVSQTGSQGMILITHMATRRERGTGTTDGNILDLRGTRMTGEKTGVDGGALQMIQVGVITMIQTMKQDSEIDLVILNMTDGPETDVVGLIMTWDSGTGAVIVLSLKTEIRLTTVCGQSGREKDVQGQDSKEEIHTQVLW